MIESLKKELNDNMWWYLELFIGNPFFGKPVYSKEEQEVMKNRCKELKLKIFLLENYIAPSYDEKKSIDCANENI
jgi:hypothetical protein